MKCSTCGGRLTGPLATCTFCGVRTDIDLRQIHFRDLGAHSTCQCPECDAALHVLEIDTDPRLHIDRCPSCHGIFFNPGELEATLDSQTHPVVILDLPQLNQIAEDFDLPRKIAYLPCPVCRERMNHLNFGGRSGVVLDHCGSHGLWVKGSQLRHLTEWWRAGGKSLHQEHQAARARQLHSPVAKARRPIMSGTTESPTTSIPDPWLLDPLPSAIDLFFDLITWGSFD